MNSNTPLDPLQMLKNLWSQFPSPIPGFVVPTADADELAKRIREFKTVEAWLQSNLAMLQGSIQALEVQQATLQALSSIATQAKAETAPGEEKSQSWPWDVLQQSGQAWIDAARTAAASPNEMAATAAKPKTKPGRKPKST